MKDLRFQKDVEILVFDTETEGLNLGSTRPWQIAFTHYKGKEIVKHKDLFLWWDDLEVSAGAAAATGFKHHIYKQKSISPQKVYDEIKPYFTTSDIHLAGHNILGFDFYVLQVLANALGDTLDWGQMIDRSIDTLALAKSRVLEESPDKSNFAAWQYKMINYYKRGMRGHSLGACCKHYNIDVDPTRQHDAAYDIYINKQVLDKQMWDYEL